VSLGGGQVDQAAVAEQVDPAAVLETELLDELADRTPFAREPLERRDVDLDVEVPELQTTACPSSRGSAPRAGRPCCP
jgi:hypothetical protein